jgi:hypothetical protein
VGPAWAKEASGAWLDYGSGGAAVREGIGLI